MKAFFEGLLEAVFTSLPLLIIAFAILIVTSVTAPAQKGDAWGYSPPIVQVEGDGKPKAKPFTPTQRLHVRAAIMNHLRRLHSADTSAFMDIAEKKRVDFGSADRYLFLMARFFSPVLKTKTVIWDGARRTPDGTGYEQRAFVFFEKKRFLIIVSLDNNLKLLDMAIMPSNGRLT